MRGVFKTMTDNDDSVNKGNNDAHRFNEKKYLMNSNFNLRNFFSRAGQVVVFMSHPRFLPQHPGDCVFGDSHRHRSRPFPVRYLPQILRHILCKQASCPPASVYHLVRRGVPGVSALKPWSVGSLRQLRRDVLVVVE